jgi:stage II sporulation protein D
MALAPVRYLYRELAGVSHYASQLTLLPNDRVRYFPGDAGIDVLVLLEDGGSFDRSSRFSHWEVRKSADELSRGVNASLQVSVGSVLELRPKRYGASGRVAELEVVGSEGSATVKGLAIRRALGIRENLFFFDVQHAPDGTVRGWFFTGRGWGHGVGLCQVGAYGMAASGFSYRDILSHYYPGTRIDNHHARP